MFAFLFSLVRREIKDARSMLFSDRAAYSIGIALAVGGSLTAMIGVTAIKIGLVVF
jgi:hypothetical protein